jgi:hypothetical protein
MTKQSLLTDETVYKIYMIKGKYHDLILYPAIIVEKNSTILFLI